MTETYDFTSTDLIHEVRGLAVDKPSYVYKAPDGDTCLNVHYDHETESYVPGCIIGNALLNLGVSVDKLLTLNEEGVSNVLTALEIDSSNKDLNWLERVQGWQDGGEHSWGRAVEKADGMDIDE